MDNLIRNCIYQGKNMLRDFGFSFWVLLYPIILVIFFNIAFSGMLDFELKDLNIGIEDNNPMEAILKEIDFVNLYSVEEEDMERSLNSGEIDGFIDENLNIKVKESGVNQTIIKNIVEQVIQMEELNKPIDNYDFSADYIVDRNQEANSIIVVFYSLIAMVSTYGLNAGITTVSLMQSNLSNIGARISTTPLRKENFLFAGIIVALLLNLTANIALLLFIKYILKISLFNETIYSSLFIIIGNLFGVSLGVFIGASNKSSMNTKTLMGVGATLFLSFLSGMMGPWMKVMIDRHWPTIGRINPISIISDNLYRINLLESTETAVSGIILLLIYCLILILTSYAFLRRRSYDSI